MNQALAVIIGATISACVTVLVVGVQHILQGRRDARERASIRLADFYTTAHALALRIGDLARSPAEEKSRVRAQIRDELAGRINSIVSSIHLHDDDIIIEIAYRIDRDLVDLTDRAEEKVWTREHWRVERTGLSHNMDLFLMESRRALGVRQLGPVRARRLPLPTGSNDLQ